MKIITLNDWHRDDGTTLRLRGVFRAINKVGYPVEVLYPQKNNFLVFLFRLLFLIKKGDILYTSSFILFPYLYLIKAFKKNVLIMDCQGIKSEESQFRGDPKILVNFYSFLERFVVKRSDFCTVVSHRIKKFYHLYSGNLVVIPLSVEIDKKFKKKKLKFKKKSRINIGVIGPFDVYHNEDSINFVLKNINSFRKGLHFHFIGKLAPDFKLSNSFGLTFHGYVDNYKEILSNMDLVLVASKRSTSGPLNKILEPLSLGVPVIATKNSTLGLNQKGLKKVILIENYRYLVKRLNGINREVLNKIRQSNEVYNYLNSNYSEENLNNKLSAFIRIIMSDPKLNIN